ncbi:hypothetical protein [Nocardia sp. NPDC003183]
MCDADLAAMAMRDDDRYPAETGTLGTAIDCETDGVAPKVHLVVELVRR